MVVKTILNLKKGFTLVELIIVAGIMLIIGLVSANLFFSILKGSLKATVIKEVKQNGDYALAILERGIRNAIDITPCNSGMTLPSITVTNSDGTTTEFSFSDTTIASSGANLISDGFFVSSYGFECNLVDERPSEVKIKFTLGKNLVSLRSEEKATVNFRTMVKIRNY